MEIQIEQFLRRLDSSTVCSSPSCLLFVLQGDLVAIYLILQLRALPCSLNLTQ